MRESRLWFVHEAGAPHSLPVPLLASSEEGCSGEQRSRQQDDVRLNTFGSVHSQLVVLICKTSQRSAAFGAVHNALQRDAFSVLKKEGEIKLRKEEKEDQQDFLKSMMAFPGVSPKLAPTCTQSSFCCICQDQQQMCLVSNNSVSIFSLSICLLFVVTNCQSFFASLWMRSNVLLITFFAWNCTLPQFLNNCCHEDHH